MGFCVRKKSANENNLPEMNQYTKKAQLCYGHIQPALTVL